MDDLNTAHLKALYSQIEEICRHFKEIRTEAAGIVEASQMPDAALHLNDVLQATEEAALVILEAAGAISTLTEDPAIPSATKDKISHEIGRIFEASGFQDISGQRIKKVLTHLHELESQLLRLSETARGQVPQKQNDPLRNGPALSAQAPSQAEIDRLFNQ